MQSENHLIFIVTDDRNAAGHLKELLEFMDAPLVECVLPAKWQSGLGNRRLSAVFLGPGMDAGTCESIISEIGELDPNTSIVIVEATPRDSDPR